uniref:(northern house mosquito) hypothetical protein n=1 Tax=Culex pipiens TaxID=7175 RepID=A0A8D8IFV4_CULPI
MLASVLFALAGSCSNSKGSLKAGLPEKKLSGRLIYSSTFLARFRSRSSRSSRSRLRSANHFIRPPVGAPGLSSRLKNWSEPSLRLNRTQTGSIGPSRCGTRST